MERGKTITIERYNKPIAQIVPVLAAKELPKRQLGFLKDAKILDPNWHAPTTDEEVDEIAESRY